MNVASPPAVVVETENGEPLVWGPFDERWNPVEVGCQIKVPGLDLPLKVTRLGYRESALHVVIASCW
jgi:hypothetical protein